ncbi:MAG: hypothetical protein EBT92_14675 [Planctomycetes bacterium]|nr:hypothetical protein [Planctomycetota bacterium]NBY02973.1 hypothetical protein [Planctomycetota bacterium]
MFTVFKTFSWTALISALGYAFVDSPETLYLVINPSAQQAQIDGFKSTFDELTAHDNVVVQRLGIKSMVFNAFRNREISIYEAASCFNAINMEGKKFGEAMAPGHENYPGYIRACLGLLFWLDDPALKGNDFEVVIDDFRNVVNIAKNGGYEIMLPHPPAKLLADFLY